MREREGKNEKDISLIGNHIRFRCNWGANAGLWDRGGGLIYDDALDITWLQEASDTWYGGTKLWEWDKANAWAASLDCYDSVRDVHWTDWRLPTSWGPAYAIANEGELSHLRFDYGITPANPGPFINMVGIPWEGFYWTDTEHPTISSKALGYYFGTGERFPEDKSKDFNVWAVMNGDVAAVPIPSAIWLLGSVIIGLVGFRRKFRKA